MYSIVLFMVETSFRGLSGSGESPRSAVESTSATTSSGTLPVNVTMSAMPSSLRQLDELVGAVSLSHEDELDVVTAGACELGGGAECEIDAILRAHDAEVGAQVSAAASPVGVRCTAPEALGIRSCPDDGDVRARHVPSSDGGGSIRVVRRDHVIGDGIRGPLEEAEAAEQAREPFGNRDSYTSGQRSCWSKTNFLPTSLNGSASAQNVSGGLHA